MNQEVRRARKKPVEIEFMVWPGGAENATPIIDWVLAQGGTARYHADDDAHYEHLQIDTLEGVMKATPGDVIIRGVQGEFYPCKPDIFKETYGLVEHIGMTMPHRISLTYTTDDDGIHLTCTCGHDKVIGHQPTISDIATATTDHLNNPEGNQS